MHPRNVTSPHADAIRRCQADLRAMRHRVDHIMASRELPRECEGGTSPGQARQLSPDPHYHDRRGGWLYHAYGEEAQARLAQPEDTALYGTNKQGMAACSRCCTCVHADAVIHLSLSLSLTLSLTLLLSLSLSFSLCGRVRVCACPAYICVCVHTRARARTHAFVLQAARRTTSLYEAVRRCPRQTISKRRRTPSTSPPAQRYKRK